MPPPVLLLLAVAGVGAACALAAFVWAVRTGQLDPGNQGASIIFEDGDTAGDDDPQRR